MGYSTKILLDSIGPSGKRLTTWELTYPRFVHSELLTHKILSRNSASSRAIPAAAMRRRVLEDPAAPVWWGANQKGMQAEVELSDVDYDSVPNSNPRQRAKDWWLRGRDLMAKHHEEGEALGIHKQIVNRVTEPWMFITVILTGTEFGNFFALRAHKDAQPEIRRVAEEMQILFTTSRPRPLAESEWHMPLLGPDDLTGGLPQAFVDDFALQKISVGRCARVSYLTHDGRRDPGEDVMLCDRLVKSGHWSPFEHVAQAMTVEGWNRWVDREWALAHGHDRCFEPSALGNLVGWKQYRKFFPNEHRRNA